MKIKLSDIGKRPCAKYYDYIIETYGGNGEFDPIDVFENIEDRRTSDVSWLLIYCKKSRKKELVEYYKSLNPSYSVISAMIDALSCFKTKKMVKYYMSLNPEISDIEWLINNCKFCQTEEIQKILLKDR